MTAIPPPQDIDDLVGDLDTFLKNTWVGSLGASMSAEPISAGPRRKRNLGWT